MVQYTSSKQWLTHELKLMVLAVLTPLNLYFSKTTFLMVFTSVILRKR
jgi:hypothetical protein